MKPLKLLRFIVLMSLLTSCGFFKDYSKGNEWSYFEEWDRNADAKIDKNEFIDGAIKDGFIKKSDGPSAADPLFAKADENQDGLLSGLEFYRWKIRM